MTVLAEALDLDDLAARLANIDAPRLAFAIARGDTRQADAELAVLDHQELLGLAVVLASRCTLLVRPETKPADELATRLTTAVHHQQRQTIDELLLSLAEAELRDVVWALASRYARPRTRPEDGQVDEIAVRRAAGGEPVLLTHTERRLAIHLMHRRGESTSQIMRQFLLSAVQVHAILDQPVQLELELPGV